MSETAQAKYRDFDVWMKLARNNPEQFEELRHEAIEDFIASVPEERKIHLRRLQWRIDRVRERAANPMAATIAISRMMWDSFYDLRDQYELMFSKQSINQELAGKSESAHILPFRCPVRA